MESRLLAEKERGVGQVGQARRGLVVSGDGPWAGVEEAYQVDVPASPKVAKGG